MEIYLVRHTTPKIEKGICYGQSDIELDQTRFETEFNAVKEKLPAKLEQVYSSPLLRCRKLAKRLQAPTVFDPRLMELNFGAWETKKWEAIAPSALKVWMQDFVGTKAGGGESYHDLHKRTLAFIDELSSPTTEENCIAIVTHAGNIRSFVSYILGLPLENSFRLQIGYGNVIKVNLGILAHEHQLTLNV
ncbi:MAG: alpha-ribazole phosphatase [Bacteroidota bacterium]